LPAAPTDRSRAAALRAGKRGKLSREEKMC
jgi:hypothetical protein